MIYFNQILVYLNIFKLFDSEPHVSWKKNIFYFFLKNKPVNKKFGLLIYYIYLVLLK